VINKAYMLI